MNENQIGFKTGEPIYLIPGVFSMYPFLIILGIIGSILTICFFWKREKYDWTILLTLIIITIPSSIIGARLFYIFERLIYNPEDPFPNSAWYKIWEGGLSIQGGVILATICDLIYIRFKRQYIDVRNAFGIIVPTILFGQAVGRWGNFTNHEVYGRICSFNDVSWLGNAISSNMFIDGHYRVPLFFYESMTSFFGYFVIVWIFNYFRILKPGTTGGIYFLYYGVVRVAMEPLREEQYFYYTLISIFSIIVGLALIAWFEISGIKRYSRYKESRYFYNWTNLKRKYIQTSTSSRWINEF